MSSVFLLYNNHRNVGFALLAFANHTADNFIAVVGHDGEVGELADEIVVSEDGVWLGQLLADYLDHPIQLGLLAEGAESQVSWIKFHRFRFTLLHIL